MRKRGSVIWNHLVGCFRPSDHHSSVNVTMPGAGRFGGLRQQAHVDDLIGHFLVDDHLVLRVDGDLDIVADGDLGMGGHRPAVEIGQRYLALATPLQFRQQRPVSPALLAQRLDLFLEVFDALAVCCGFRDIALVSCRRYSSRRLSTALMKFSSEFFVKLRSLLSTALMRVPSTASSSRPKRLNSRHSNVNWRNTARKAARLSLRKSAIVLKSGFKVRNSQITSMLRWHSTSNCRLDRTRLR